MFRSAAIPLAAVLGAGAGSHFLLQGPLPLAAASAPAPEDGLLARGPLPTRAQQIARLRTGTRDNPFDVLIIGGGATGAGCALDAATRGFRTALVERGDFGCGTSSKSTKLVHGGVRYLEKAVFNLDSAQLKLVYEALQERSDLLANAPHLSRPLPILMPCYKWWEVPFYWAGLKMYDLVAGMRNLGWSSYVTPSESLRQLPTLADPNPSGRSLKGTIRYYDGQFDDARLNVALACTAAAAGAAVANHAEAAALLKDSHGHVVGARVTDKETGRAFEVHARVVVNATGPWADQLRQLSDPGAKKSVTASAGAHVTLPDYYGGGGVGMIVPKTKDGRVVFMLPWEGRIIAGTTDAPIELTDTPAASGAEVDFILDALSDFLSIKVRRSDVLSCWSGIRPLASDPTQSPAGGGETQNIVREHVIFTDADGLVTVTGGKWTTYRRMAEDVVDALVNGGRLPTPQRPCATQTLRLLGARGYSSKTAAEVAQRGADIAASPLGMAPGPRHSVTPDQARRLASAYGDRAFDVLELVKWSDGALAAPLAPGLPVIEAEVVHAVRQEYAASVEDFLMRRTRLAFLDAAAAEAAAPRVAELMAGELGWGTRRRRAEAAAAVRALRQQFAIPPPAEKEGAAGGESKGTAAAA
ncbi:glycerol-3-phosphate dehydrogenase mitochondrial-like [Raphidocelis subcapitata]|uniref:Glycerol-3-phosphate dehydrogenase n=1 Tax=Raphidocelis subcapitata TaxID=307507 RepID=A0A2V0P2V8_9CHLO|nr:glycerol-3-phosphate dehydrogenase mitochondrial-like [Raphidocelis subcapitata]|eukprot:GBF94204.1 glycerol-3-phosphate dehydrogenase mitochondrial-like [Raphidocelis subcapitata]